MAPLKDYFLGLVPPPHPRLCNVQPCLRTTDIDLVGDRHHLTYFAMLGSWSIGDYHKEKAIEYAYELLVQGFGFDPKRLYVTVFAGDKGLNLPPDETSARIWEQVGIPPARIVLLGKEDNFWGPAGNFGPCGACTEVFYDCGAEFGKAYKQGENFDTTSRYIEIWNAGVFIELEKKSDGRYLSLPLKSVDTGSGLERMAMVMQGVADVYHTDSLFPIVKEISKNFPVIAQARILTDHLRAATAIMSEGIAPDNSGRGYVLRRLLRKCIALSLSGLDSCANLDDYIALIIEQTNAPQFKQAQDFIQQQFRREVADFEPIVQAGLRMLAKKLSATNDKHLSADTIFELVATHGLPLPMISNYLRRHGYSFDAKAYTQQVATHRNISRSGRKDKEIDAILQLLQATPATVFVGYQQLEQSATALQLLQNTAEGTIQAVEEVTVVDAEFLLVADTTPFYAEAGGQVGDSGKGKANSAVFVITDVQKKNDYYLHYAKLTAGCLRRGEAIELHVDAERRKLVRRNHSLTHLLQGALRKTIGTHIAQKGSYVDEHKLRFDFQHDKALQTDEIQAVERLVNSWIWQDLPRRTETIPYRAALERGALYMLGENYQDKVRVISFGEVSVELCGGTHVQSTGEIGMLRIISETSIAKGVRRIEGISGHTALHAFQNDSQHLQQACIALNTRSDNLLARIKQIQTKHSHPAPQKIQTQNEYTSEKQNLTVCIAHVEGDAKALRQLCNERKHDITAMCLVAKDSYSIAVATRTATGTSARLILQKLFARMSGKGGGKDDYAQGGGKIAGLSFSALADAFKQTLQELHL